MERRKLSRDDLPDWAKEPPEVVVGEVETIQVEGLWCDGFGEMLDALYEAVLRDSGRLN